MNYIETCTKIAVFLWRSSNYRPLTSVLHVRPGWIIYQNMRETWEKKVMKFEREIPIGLDARRKKWQGGAIKAPPNGIRVKQIYYSYQQTEFTLSKLTANGNLGNLLSATLQGCLAHVYMYAIVVPNLIWMTLFSQLLAYVVTMATHIPLL